MSKLVPELNFNIKYFKSFLLIKIAIFLILISARGNGIGYAQNTVTLSEKNAPFARILKKIQRQTGFSYFAEVSLLEKAANVNIEVKDVPLTVALEIIFKNQPLTYSIIGRTIVIKQKEGGETYRAPVSFSSGNINVRGRVMNEKGEALAGVTVTVKGKNVATSTDENGEFSIQTVDEDAVLVFSSVNMETFELKVNGKSELEVNLKTKVTALGDVTITVNTGYQQLPKERATGSFEHVSHTELNQRIGSDILSRLDGVSNSVLFDRRSLSPNTNSINAYNLVIRGISTLTQDIKAPLIIVNNFPYDGDISNINPNDVESITILKDAAAASIWGAKAGNGVIVITTIQGYFNSPSKVIFNTNYSVIPKPDLFYYPKMTSSEFIDVEEFLFNKGFYNATLNNTVARPVVSPVVEILAARKAGLISVEDSIRQISALRNNDIRNDFSDYIYRKSQNQQYSLNVTGGGNRIRYAFLGGYDRNVSNLIGNTSERISFRTDNTINPAKNLEVRVGIAYTNSFAKSNSLGDISHPNYDPRFGQKIYPYVSLVDESGNPTNIYRDYRIGYVDTAGGGKLLNWSFSPLNEIVHADVKYKLQDIILNVGAKYKILKGLYADLSFQYENSNAKYSNYRSVQSYYTRNLINLFSQVSSSGVTYRVPKGGILDENLTDLLSKNGRVQLNFNKSLSNIHEINAIAGSEVRERISTGTTRRQYGFNKENFSFSNVDYVNTYPQYGGRGNSLIPNVDSYTEIKDRFVSFYSNAAYTFDKRYTLSASARKDASNLFGIDINNKWKPLWSVGLAWNLKNESFFKLEAISTLRLRCTYGYQGNVNNSISPYTIITLNSASTSLINQPFASITKAADPSLSWESISQFNFGIDFGLFKNRITASFEVFQKKSDNIIYPASVDPTVGIFNLARNSASIKANGIDILLSSANLKGKLEWRTDFSFSYVRDRVTDFKIFTTTASTLGNLPTLNGITMTPMKGKSIYSIYSLPFAGLDPQTGDPLGYKGKIISKDYRGILTQSIDTSNLIYHGSAIPTSFGFINNTFSFKGFSLTANISYRLGYYFKKTTISYFQLFTSGLSHHDFSKRWLKPGDEASTSVPSMIYPASDSYRDDFYAGASVNVLKGDNIRLEYLKFSYQFPHTRASFPNAQIYVNVSNIGILWRANKENLDPDYDIGNMKFPRPRQYAVGIRLTL